MHLTAVLNKGMSQQVGGSQIGGFMNTALANNQGELVMPVIVTGTFQHPQIAPDVQQLAKMKLDNLLPTSKNPGALTSGIVGAILGNKNQPTENNGAQPNGGIGGIVGAITGKKQQPPNQTQPQQQNQVGNNSDQQQQQNQNPLGDVLNKVLEQRKKKQQQQQNPPQQQSQPPQ